MELKIEPFDDYETVKKKADEYIIRIKYGVDLLKRLNHNINPTVFISPDILSVIAEGAREVRLPSYETPAKQIMTVCGCKLKTVADKNVLAVGLDLV